MKIRVKICGITNPEDALRSIDLGAAMLGLNFYQDSMRHITVERAREIALAVNGRATLVGVFVKEQPHRIEEIAEQVGLDLLQLHGDEPPEAVAHFGARAIKVIRWERRPSQEELDAYPDVWGFLLDRKLPGIFGGGGQPWNYAEARDLPTGKPVIVAGGIGPDNVRQVIEQAQPWGIDVCSKIERVAGTKDPLLLRRLFEEIADV